MSTSSTISGAYYTANSDTTEFYLAMETQYVLGTTMFCGVDEKDWDEKVIDTKSDYSDVVSNSTAVTRSEVGEGTAEKAPVVRVDDFHEDSTMIDAEDDVDIDVDDASDDGGASVWCKSLLGPVLHSIEQLCTYPRPDEYGSGPPNLDAPPSVISDYDHNGEFAGYRYIRGILAELGTDCEAIATDHSAATMPDGSKIIVKDLYNAYHKERTGYDGFTGVQVSDKVKLKFMEVAGGKSKHKPMLTKRFEEYSLNRGCFEQHRNVSSSWSEDFDKFPVALAMAEYPVKLLRNGNTKAMRFSHGEVRNDWPADPHLFSRHQLGVEAARALQKYQNDDEQLIDKRPVADYEQPHFAHGLTLEDLPGQQYRHLHEKPNCNNDLVTRALEAIQGLGAHPEEYEYQCQVAPYEASHGSWGFDRDGVSYCGEFRDITAIWDALRE
ncbi:hypothetical protein ACN47E_009437 [Coniothyrium glycines]